MIVSYKWLQTYFDDKLPAPVAVAEAFTFGAFEVEGMEEVESGKSGDDVAIDLKVLPDRACYALSHRGVAYELAAITGQKMVDVKAAADAIGYAKIDAKEKVSVTVADKVLCRRYCARYIKNVKIADSPAWLRERLEAVGQRAINTIVDATNFVMLDMGQPLHAFDADKLKGGIVVRRAKAGEMIELLPEKGTTEARNIALQADDLVIADDEGPVAIAGVKGGMRAAVTETTKNLIIESANFDPVSVRKTSTRLALRNDASKRFENNLPVDFAPQAMEEVSALIKKLCPKASVGEVTDIFSGPAKKVTVAVSSDFISARLGKSLSVTELEEIFSRLQIGFEKKTGKKGENKNDVYSLTIPPERLDLNMPEDMVEEVGRIYGYDKIAPAIPKKVAIPVAADHFAYWTEKVKDVLFDLGFSEVQTSSFATTGDVEVQNPLALDKKFLRNKLYEGFSASLDRNGKNAALFGSDEIKTFEIGTVFGKGESEQFNLALGVYVAKNIKNKDRFITGVIDEAFRAISKAVGKDIKTPKLSSGQADQAGQAASGAAVATSSFIAEINLSDIISALPAPKVWDIQGFSRDIKYKPFSAYPFMVRDVAVFVPSSISEKKVSAVIDSTAGPLMIRRDLFDVFTKKFENGEEKTSYAFHIVFQSYERTLREEEVNTIMKNISDSLTAQSWQVR